jgi:predicted DNA-binding protein
MSKKIRIPIEDYERLERIASKMNKTPEEAFEEIILKKLDELEAGGIGRV